MLVFLHLWWLPILHQGQADSIQHEGSPGTTGVFPHSSALGWSYWQPVSRGCSSWSRNWAGFQGFQTELKRRKRTPFLVSHLHQAFLLQKLRTDKRQPRGPLWNTLFNVEKHSIQTFEKPILWDCHCINSSYLLLLVNSEYNLESLAFKAIVNRSLATLADCIRSILSPCSSHSSPTSLLTGALMHSRAAASGPYTCCSFWVEYSCSADSHLI